MTTTDKAVEFAIKTPGAGAGQIDQQQKYFAAVSVDQDEDEDEQRHIVDKALLFKHCNPLAKCVERHPSHFFDRHLD